MEWKKYRLGDLACSIQTGPFGSQLHQSDYSSNGTPVIMPKDMMDGKISESSIARVADDHVERLKRHKVKSGDVVYSRRGDVGRCVLITDKEDGWLCGTGCLKVELDDQKVLPSFLFYILQRKDSVGWVENHAVGSTMPNLNTGILSKLPVMLPTLKEQQCIVSILSACDKLIENNNKRIRILEKMAENLYTEWFVRFRFPGHENVPMENGLPKGWRYIIVGERYNVTIGKTPPRKEFEWFVSNDVNAQNWLTISDMKGMFVWDTAEQITRTALERFNMVIVPAKTILLSFKLTVGRVTIASVPLCTNEAIAHFVNVPTIEHEYLYQQLRLFDYRKLGNTSAIGNAINSKIVKSMKLVLPTTDKLETFHKMVAPIFNKILSLTKQSSNLARQRDLLLPRLMSGKLSISVD